MKTNNRLVKRVGALVLCGTLAAGMFLMNAGAVNTNVTAQLSPNINVVVDGTTRTFYNAGGTEVHPIVYNGTTYLPLRAIGELMGKNVNWDQNTMTASLSGTRTDGGVAGTPDNTTATQNVAAVISTDITVQVDGVTRTFSNANGTTVYPLVYNGSIYLPLRAIGNLMGKNVGWDGTTSTAVLSSDGLVITDADSFENTGNNGNTGNTGNTGSGQTTTGLLTADQAKSKALAHAGLSSSQVTFVQAKLEWDDGVQIYDVEFYTSDYKEYDYEINAKTGAILSYDYDADQYTPPANQTGSYIGESKAKSIALFYVSGATLSNVRSCKLDRDDGRMEYEVEIIYGTMEYDFEIDAYTGAVISRDVDSIYD